MVIKKYPYKQKWWIGPACVIFFGLCAWMFWRKTHEQPRGLILNRIIELAPSNAQIFYWILFAASVLFVMLGILVFLNSFKKERYITLLENSIRAPKNGFSDIEIDIPFKNISSIKLEEIQRQNFLHINHPGGKTSIAQSMLPSKAEFEELCSTVAFHVTRVKKTLPSNLA